MKLTGRKPSCGSDQHLVGISEASLRVFACRVTLRQEIRFWESEAKPPEERRKGARPSLKRILCAACALAEEEQDHYNGFVRKSVVEKLGQAVASFPIRSQ